MSSTRLQAVILAAGSSSRFCTSYTKLCAPLCGKELVLYPISLFASLEIPTICVVGHQKELVQAAITKNGFSVHFVEQTEQLGTGHALKCTHPWWQAESIIVLNGDTPFITPELINELVASHEKSSAAVSLVVARSTSQAAQAFGRFSVNSAGNARIIEKKHDPEARSAETLLNAGLYIFKKEFLEQEFTALRPHSESGEIYLPDLIERASTSNTGISWIETSFDLIRGINTLAELAEAEHIERKRHLEDLMAHGVRFIDPSSTVIDRDVTIRPDSVIGQGCHITGKTMIGAGCSIGAYSIVSDAHLEDNVCIKPHTIINKTNIGSNAQIGPFAHVVESIVEAKATIGNFVEVKRSTVGAGSKAKHLSYLGDAVVGKNVNIGAGTIICNYNGIAKYPTIIGDGANIGSLNALIAPLTVGSQAITGAGSVITESVPADALAIARAQQVTKPNYAPLLRERLLRKAEQEEKVQPKESDDSVHSHSGQSLRHGELRKNRQPDGNSQPAS